MNPDISVIMGVYNGEEYISETIESLINQTFKNWELVVINDCSTDSTGEILEKYAAADNRIRVYLNEVNLRLPSSLNKAISLCGGKYIARMDADDICLPDRFEKQFLFMEANPEVSLSSCRFMTVKNGVYSSGGCGGRCDSEAVKALLLVTNPIMHPGVIARAEVMRELLYDPSCTCTEDLDLWTRVVKGNYKIEIIPEYLLIYRLHDKQITATTLEKQHREVVAIQKRYLGELIGEMKAHMEEFYISGIYFKEKTDINEFLRFFEWAKAANKNKKNFHKNALQYAFFEILAEYKRCGVSKFDILKGIVNFNALFLVKEVFRRKKVAKRDGRRCIIAAEKMGLQKVGGTLEFPVFKQKDIQGLR